MYADNPHYRASAHAIRALHRLIREGRGDSPEADQIRDESDHHWSLLGLQEMDRLQDLSSDLYMIAQPLRPRVVIRSPDVSNAQEVCLRATGSGDFERARFIVRQNPSDFTSYAVAQILGSYWFMIGEYDSSLLFLDEVVDSCRASDCPPQMIFQVRLSRLFLYWRNGNEKTMGEADELLDDPWASNPDDTIEVGVIMTLSLYETAASQGRLVGGLDQDELTTLDRVARKLHSALLASPGVAALPSFELGSLAHQVLGLCHLLRAEVESGMALDADTMGGERTVRDREILDKLAEAVKRRTNSLSTRHLPRSAA